MKSVIINKDFGDMGIPDRILNLLPYRLSDAIRKEMRADKNIICEEIRIRRGRMSALTLTGGIIVPLDISLSKEEMETTVENLCGGSMYAHIDTLKQGYISLPHGVRAGVSGRASVEGGRVIGISDVNGICIRIPHFVKIDTTSICKLLKQFDFTSGILIYSPPGEGKTTLLRSIAAELSKGKDAVRVCVVDSRGELEFGLESRNVLADVLSGYPKALGIEIALRTMNAQVIICDEIGNTDEVDAICSAANGGAALIASTHASDIKGLMEKKNIKKLHDAGVFGAYVGISRKEGEYAYDISYAKDI